MKQKKKKKTEEVVEKPVEGETTTELEPVEGESEVTEEETEVVEVAPMKESKLKKVTKFIKEHAPMFCAAAGAVTMVVIQTVIKACLDEGTNEEEETEDEDVDYVVFVDEEESGEEKETTDPEPEA